MTFAQFGAIVIKRWRLVVICFLVVGIATLIVTWYMPPTYQSTAWVQINLTVSSKGQPDYNSAVGAENLVQTEAQLATANSVLESVASHYPGMTVDHLARAITSTPQTGTLLFEVTAKDSSASRAAELANDVVNTFVGQQQQAGGRFLSVAQWARIENVPASPSVPLYTAGGFLAGLCLGVLLALLMEQLQTRGTASAPVPQSTQAVAGLGAAARQSSSNGRILEEVP